MLGAGDHGATIRRAIRRELTARIHLAPAAGYGSVEDRTPSPHRVTTSGDRIHHVSRMIDAYGSLY